MLVMCYCYYWPSNHIMATVRSFFHETTGDRFDILTNLQPHFSLSTFSHSKCRVSETMLKIHTPSPRDHISFLNITEYGRVFGLFGKIFSARFTLRCNDRLERKALSLPCVRVSSLTSRDEDEDDSCGVCSADSESLLWLFTCFFSCVVVLWFCPVQGFFYIFQDKRIFHLPFQDYWKKRFWKKKNSQIENSEILEILFRVSWSPSLRFCPRAKTKISDLKYSEKISESFRGFLVFDSPD